MSKTLANLLAVVGMNLPLAIVMMQPAQALPEAQILEKLRVVPTFTVMMSSPDGKKGLLQQTQGKGADAKSFTRVFVDLKDAQAFLASFVKQQPQLSKSVQVIPIPLSDIYKMQLEAKQKSQNVSFVYIPTEPQIREALSILKEPYKKNAAYPVPLFVVAIKEKTQNIANQRNDMTQLFFDKQQAQEWLNLAKRKNPQLAAKAEITVETLDNMLDSLTKLQDPGQQQWQQRHGRPSVRVRRAAPKSGCPSSHRAPARCCSGSADTGYRCARADATGSRRLPTSPTPKRARDRRRSER